MKREIPIIKNSCDLEGIDIIEDTTFQYF